MYVSSNGQRRYWPDSVGAQTELSFRCAHVSEGRFSHINQWPFFIGQCVKPGSTHQGSDIICLYFQFYTLQKHAYSNILKIFPPKHENFQVKNSDIFHISAQNIDCWYSLEPPRWGAHNICCFLYQNKKKNVYPCKPQFYYIKVGFNGVKITQACFQQAQHIFPILYTF